MFLKLLAPMAFGALLAANVANAGVFVGGGVGAVDGLVAEAGLKLNPFVSVRARATYLPSVNVNNFVAENVTNVEGARNGLFNNFDSKFKSHSADLGLEIRPLPIVPILRSFVFIGAVQYLDANLDISRNINGNVVVNGNNYNVNGTMNFTVSNKNRFAPYVGIGYDILNLPFISLRGTIGATLRSFEVERANYNLSGVNQADIDAEIKALNRRLNKNTIIPSVTLTARLTI